MFQTWKSPSVGGWMTRGWWMGGFAVGAIGGASFGSFDGDLGGSLGALPPVLLSDDGAPGAGRGCAPRA